jgi:hypothetical protein
MENLKLVTSILSEMMRNNIVPIILPNDSLGFCIYTVETTEKHAKVMRKALEHEEAIVKWLKVAELARMFYGEQEFSALADDIMTSIMESNNELNQSINERVQKFIALMRKISERYK